MAQRAVPVSCNNTGQDRSHAASHSVQHGNGNGNGNHRRKDEERPREEEEVRSSGSRFKSGGMSRAWNRFGRLSALTGNGCLIVREERGQDVRIQWRRSHRPALKVHVCHDMHGSEKHGTEERSGTIPTRGSQLQWQKERACIPSMSHIPTLLNAPHPVQPGSRTVGVVLPCFRTDKCLQISGFSDCPVIRWGGRFSDCADKEVR